MIIEFPEGGIDCIQTIDLTNLVNKPVLSHG